VDFILPATNGRWDGFLGRADKILAFPAGLRDVAPLHDDLDATADTDEEDGQSRKLLGAVGEDVAGNGVGIVMADINHDIQTQPAVRSDGLIQGGVEHWDKRLEILTLASWTEAMPGP
jgi:hypothetical protein